MLTFSTTKLLAIALAIFLVSSVQGQDNPPDESGADLDRHGSKWLGTCQGDCDYDSDCYDGLRCYQRNYGDPVPCCPQIGTGGKTDYCAPPNCVTPRPTPAPVAGPPTSSSPTVRPNVNVGVYACFSGDATVDVLHKGSVPMKDLLVGERVFAYVNGKYQYTKVYAFGHRNPKEEATFLVIKTAEPLAPLEITSDHLIYLSGRKNPVLASAVRVGDRIAPSDAVVTSILSVTKTGIYTPLTDAGTFLVNGNLHVSSYAAIAQPKNEYWSLANGTPLISHQNGIHLALTPYRLWCHAVELVGGKCQVPTTNVGMPEYVSQGIALLHWADQQSTVGQLFLLISLVIPIFSCVWVLEQIALEPQNLVAFWFIALGLGGFTLWSKNKPLLKVKSL